MTDQPLTDNQALSILNQVEAEINAALASKRGFQHVRQVITKFIEAQKYLADFEKTQKGLEESIAGLRPRLEANLRTFSAELATKKAALNSEIETMLTRAQEARRSASVAESEAKEKIETAAARTNALDKAIAEKQGQLDKLKAAISELKTVHRI